MGSSFIPLKDSQLDDWVLNFKTLIVANPTNYGLVVGDGTAIQNAYNTWHTAFLAATNPTTRTHATIITKREQKANVLTVVRMYSGTIRSNHAVSDELKVGLGLHVPDHVITPVPPPATAPALTLGGTRTGIQEVRAADETTPNRRARPDGTSGLLLFRAVATTPVGSPTDAGFLSFVTKGTFQSTFVEGDNGKTATYFARWTNAKGEMGPWSQPLVVRIAA